MDKSVEIEEVETKSKDKATRKMLALEHLLSKASEFLIKEGLDKLELENYFWKLSIEFKRRKKD